MRKKLNLSEGALSELGGLSGAPVLSDEPMSSHTTFRLGGPADYLVTPTGRQAFVSALKWAVKNQIPYLVMGAGSNLIVSDRGIRGLVLKTSRMREWSMSRGLLSVEAGMPMPQLSSAIAEAGWSGFEESCGIPGTVGGGLCMNAGAYGWNISSVTHRVVAVTISGDEIELSLEEMAFGKKTSAIIRDNLTCLMLEARLTASDPSKLKERITSLLKDRASKQPLDLPNAGCIFKNPSGGGAGRLIDAAGLKGFRVGGAEVSKKHANFIVNAGGATSSDVKAIMDKVSRIVYEGCGERLEPEVRLVGDWDEQ